MSNLDIWVEEKGPYFHGVAMFISTFITVYFILLETMLPDLFTFSLVIAVIIIVILITIYLYLKNKFFSGKNLITSTVFLFGMFFYSAFNWFLSDTSLIQSERNIYLLVFTVGMLGVYGMFLVFLKNENITIKVINFFSGLFFTLQGIIMKFQFSTLTIFLYIIPYGFYLILIARISNELSTTNMIKVIVISVLLVTTIAFLVFFNPFEFLNSLGRK